MEILLGVLALGGLAGAARTVQLRIGARRHARETAEAELATIRRFASEDTMLLGEELRRLDTRTADHPLDENARLDYQTALDAYERAQGIIDNLADADEVSRVVDALASGRFALACVDARVEGRPLPERTAPCFFNPRHGPSVKDVVWTPPGRGSRHVGACAQDAERCARNEEPEVLYLRIDGRKVPYWDAGRALQPYARGYFPTTVADARRDAQAKGQLYGSYGSTDPTGGISGFP